MKKRLNIFLGVILTGMLLIFLWWKQALQPVNPNDNKQITFTVSRGVDARTIADNLRKTGLIRSPVAFFLLARFGNLGANLQSGNFRLNPSMNLHEIAQTLTHGTQDVWITIPEGWRREEISLKIAKELSIPENEFLKLAKEGYLFPDTYLIPQEASATAIIDIFNKNFQKKVTAEIIAKANRKNLNSDDLIIVASLVEREARLTEDRPLVASVILNRLKIGMKLDIDATIQYALGYQPDQKSWWKKDLTAEDMAIDSPYNTYTNPGLPPTPIANSGLAAINAVVEAPETDYLYYVADKNGKSHFAKDIEEHNANISTYLIR